ncbi:hypothetical protein EIK80_23015 [Caulobacter sp. 602-1]|nr:hypothetical protein [Caulobacter sp. 602-1]RRN62286.1 hypothetical protein EIK80_23015 [Caulobacter sp. 602-1]
MKAWQAPKPLALSAATLWEPFAGGLRSPNREAVFRGAPVLKRRRRVSGSSKAVAFPYLIQTGG